MSTEIAARYSAIAAMALFPIAFKLILDVFESEDFNSDTHFKATVIMSGIVLLTMVIAYFEGLTRIKALAGMMPNKWCQRVTTILLWIPVLILIPLGAVLFPIACSVLLLMLYGELHRDLRKKELQVAEMRNAAVKAMESHGQDGFYLRMMDGQPV